VSSVTVTPDSPPYEYPHTQRLALWSELQRGTNMIRKLILAVTAAVALGSVTLVAMDDASARGFGGGGFHRGGGGGGGMRMGGGGGFRLGGGGWGGHRGGGWGGHHGGWGHHNGWGHNRHWGYRGYGYRYGSYGSYAPSYVAPVYSSYSAPSYSAPAPAYSAPSAPVCQSCGGWTEDGGYMAYRKVTNEQTGQPELRCVKILDEQPQQSSAGPIPYPGPQQQASAAPIPYPGR
jgi:hypothetical protein